MEMKTIDKNKISEKVDIGKEIEFLAYGEISKKNNSMIKATSNESFGGKLCVVTIVNADIYLLVLDNEAKSGRAFKINIDDIEKVRFTPYLLGLGRKMRLKAKDGDLLDVKFIKRVDGVKEQRIGVKRIEEKLTEIVG